LLTIKHMEREMKKALTAVLAAACLAVFAIPGWAKDPAPFNPAELNKFISDYPGFVSFMKTQEKAIEDAGNPDAWQSMQASNRMASYLNKKGWKPERFFYVLSHANAGLAAVTLEEQAPQIQSQFSESRKAIQNNPMFSAEMKQQLLAQMQQGEAQAKKMDQMGKDLPPLELKLIRKNKDRLMHLFESQ